MMRRNRRRRRLQGPWRGVHSAIWLIGLAFLFYSGRFWPGILILVAASTILEIVISSLVPNSTEEIEEEAFRQPRAAVEEGRPFDAPPAPVESLRTAFNRVDLLPANCPRCGAPVRGEEVKWTSTHSATCSFCGSALPMMKP